MFVKAFDVTKHLFKFDPKIFKPISPLQASLGKRNARQCGGSPICGISSKSICNGACQGTFNKLTIELKLCFILQPTQPCLFFRSERLCSRSLGEEARQNKSQRTPLPHPLLRDCLIFDLNTESFQEIGSDLTRVSKHLCQTLCQEIVSSLISMLMVFKR